MRHDADSQANRHAAVKRQLRLLYTGYRNLRYKLEDEWPAGLGSVGVDIFHIKSIQMNRQAVCTTWRESYRGAPYASLPESTRPVYSSPSVQLHAWGSSWSPK